MFRNGAKKIVIDYYVWDNVRELCFLRDPETISEWSRMAFVRALITSTLLAENIKTKSPLLGCNWYFYVWHICVVRSCRFAGKSRKSSEVSRKLFQRKVRSAETLLRQKTAEEDVVGDSNLCCRRLPGPLSTGFWMTRDRAITTYVTLNQTYLVNVLALMCSMWSLEEHGCGVNK